MKTLIDKIDDNTESHHTFWQFPAEKKQYSLWHLMTVSKNYAEKLLMLGVKKQDRVGLVMNNTSDYVAMLLAIWRINAIAVMVRPKGTKYTKINNFLQYCDHVCHLNLIIYDDTISTPDLENWFIEKHQRSAITIDKFKQLESAHINLPNIKITANDVAILQFSSGSTGHPKGVIVNHGMMIKQLENIAVNHKASRHGLAVKSMASWMPVHHDLGLFIGVLAPIFCNTSNILVPPSYYLRNPERWFSLLSEYQVDFTFSTNSALATSFNAVKRLHMRDDVDLSKLHIYLASEKVSPITVKKCWSIFTPLGLPKEQLHIGYGMAENTLGCCSTKTKEISLHSFILTEQKNVIPVEHDTAGSVELVAVGQADRFHEISIRDEYGNRLPQLHLGEIHVQSPCVSPGYFNNPALSTIKFKKGMFCTEDLGFYYQGELYFYARKDDMIIVGGRNIIPYDIEECVELLDYVAPASSCLVSKENQLTGNQELVLIVEERDDFEHQSQRQKTRLIQKQAMIFQNIWLEHIVFCKKGTVEKTSSGKKRRKVIQERLVNNQLELLDVEYA